MLKTQLGLGVVELDHQGLPVPASTSRARFVVTPGPRPGQLLLTAVSEAAPAEPGALVVSLAGDADLDERRLARALVGLR